MNTVARSFLHGFLATLTLIFTANAQARPPMEVIAYQAEPIERPQSIEALGHLQAGQSTDITATVTDTIHAIHFEAGQNVRQSQLLVELNSAEELARLEEAKVRAEEAKRQYQRTKEIEGRGSVTRSLIDQRYREWQTAIAQRKIIEAQVADRRIYAPFAGTLGITPFSVGALVTPGTRIVTLDNTNNMKLDLLVPSRYLRFLKPGLTVTLRSDAFPDRVFSGQIQAISPRLQEQVRMVQVRARIDNPDGALKANMLVEAHLDLPPETQLVVPNTALLMIGDHEYVYRLKAGEKGLHQAEKVEVVSGEIGASTTQILKGLQPGDLVVSQGVMRVNVKQPVKIKAFQNDADQANLLKAKAAH